LVAVVIPDRLAQIGSSSSNTDIVLARHTHHASALLSPALPSMAPRCDGSSIALGLIDPEFRQLAADTIGATEHGNDKFDLRVGDGHIGEADLTPSILRRADPSRTSRKPTRQPVCSVGHRLPITRSRIIAPLKLGEPPNMPNKAPHSLVNHRHHRREDRTNCPASGGA
jgi:hypothetical protein